MTNTQFGFNVTAPTSGTLAYGCSVKFTVPTGIDTISGKAGAGGWCTAGNLLVFSGTGQSGNYLECSITYANGCSGCPATAGWYFWYGYNGVGSWSALGTSPVGDVVTLDIQWNGSQFQASLTDASHSGNNKSVGFGVGTPAQFNFQSGNVWFENGGDTTCADYSGFNSLPFTNLTYYSSTGSTITFTYTKTTHVLNNPNGCTPTVTLT
ncbi:MAG: hypothetical protein ACYDAJ_00400 [Nitrosotalea sp.]